MIVKPTVKELLNHAENRFKRVDSWYDVEKYIKEKYNG